MSNTLNRKLFTSILVLSSLVFGSFVFASHAFATTAPKVTSTKVTGMAKFVLKGTVMTTSADSLMLHVTNTSKNVKRFDNKDQTITIGKNTKITKNGHVVAFSKITKGDIIKVFGIFDKKSGTISLVRWIKVMPAQLNSGIKIY